MPTRETKVALTSSWLIISSILLVIILSPYVWSDEALLSASEVLQFQHLNQERCPLCGMTRAFIAISRGDLDGAIDFNRWSIALYQILLANELLVSLFLISRVRRLSCSIVRRPVVNLARQQKRRENRAVA